MAAVRDAWVAQRFSAQQGRQTSTQEQSPKQVRNVLSLPVQQSRAQQGCVRWGH